MTVLELIQKLTDLPSDFHVQMSITWVNERGLNSVEGDIQTFKVSKNGNVTLTGPRYY